MVWDIQGSHSDNWIFRCGLSKSSGLAKRAGKSLKLWKLVRQERAQDRILETPVFNNGQKRQKETEEEHAEGKRVLRGLLSAMAKAAQRANEVRKTCKVVPIG